MLAEVRALCAGKDSLAEAARARIDALMPALLSCDAQLQQEQQAGSQHPASLSEPLHQLEPDRPHTLKRGVKALYGGRSKEQCGQAGATLQPGNQRPSRPSRPCARCQPSERRWRGAVD